MGLPPLFNNSIGNFLGGPGPIYSGIPINTSNPVTLESNRPITGGYSGGGETFSGGMQEVECCEVVDAIPGQPVEVQTVPVEEDCGCGVPQNVIVEAPVEVIMDECGECGETMIEGVPSDVTEAPIFPAVSQPSFLKRFGNWLSR